MALQEPITSNRAVCRQAAGEALETPELGPRAVRGGRSLLGLFLIVATGQAVLTYPQAMGFVPFAFGDKGASLAVEYFEDLGQRPNIDFCHQYGMLTLLIGRAWFGLLGRTPGAFYAFMLVSSVLIIWGLARVASALCVGGAGRLLLLLTLPEIAGPDFAGLVYPLERCLLCHALAEHAWGRRPSALTLCAVATFIKPTMAYVYGLLLVILMLREVIGGREDAARPWWRPFLPAAAAMVGLFVLSVLVYGHEAAVQTFLFPFTRGPEHYRLMGYGFFRGTGRHFWALPGARPGYYLGTHAGLWIAATLYLAAAVITLPWRRRAPDHPAGAVCEFNDEIQVVCLLMHLGFVTLFFGNAWSWRFYFYILLIGVIATSRRDRIFRSLIWPLVLLAILPLGLLVREWINDWRTLAPRSEVAGLWVSPAVWREWQQVLEITRGSQPVLLTFCGSAELLESQLARPTTLWLLPGEATPRELTRKHQQIRSTEMVVVDRFKKGHRGFLDYWPEFAAELSGWNLIWDGPYFQVYRRPAHGTSHPRWRSRKRIQASGEGSPESARHPNHRCRSGGEEWVEALGTRRLTIPSEHESLNIVGTCPALAGLHPHPWNVSPAAP
ncbi:MAG: hypothetical protein IRY99_07015 [Isosphaeraceae bacterium]|nr:hypothetical protein [Isosphaeraceae bacterium]